MIHGRGRLTYACWANNSLGIKLSKNLISNIGFGPDATNTSFTHNNYFGFPEKDIILQNLPPKEITRCFEFDKKYFQLEKGTLVRKFKNIIKSLLDDFVFIPITINMIILKELKIHLRTRC